ncbi:MAG: hypothetical protein Q7Q71_13305 [Verrucomicrobiota bacterium JB023]|nr:hypothetical protein [Verrucomicrobiota bacterium JB023]
MLVLIAFVELVAVGMALALHRQEPMVTALEGEEQVVERVVTQIVEVPGEEREVIVEKIVEKEIPALPDGPPQFLHQPVDVHLTRPPIADPIVEKYVEESQAARIAGDIALAMLKIEEAYQREPEDPNVLYQLAEIYEASGIYDKAGDYYLQVFEQGTLKAGSLYEFAAAKLLEGIEQPEDMAGKFALGRVRAYQDKDWEEGERVILTIPVSAAPNLGLDEQQTQALQVTVHIYDKVDSKPVLRDEFTSSVETYWVTSPIDWRDGGEELMRVIYEIPYQGAAESHLLGRRQYLGQVVELLYQGELIDRVASPRHLATGRDTRADDLYFYPENYIPDDFNYENPLLPPLPD